jgi:hypothetical protein
MRYLSEANLLPLRKLLRTYEEHLKEAKSDPPTEPYKSKYLAIGCLGRQLLPGVLDPHSFDTESGSSILG